MSYLVLARKYRPKTFAELVGQAHVVQALTNALRSGRLHHAYLFTGTRGVGKTTVSRILAKSLNCVGPDGTGSVTDAPCGVCDPCRDIDRGRFVDYTELDAASNRGVDEVQSLLEQAVYKPVQGRFKVFMIDEVHMLSGHAFNAMLKTLEEPPEYLKFVLATTDPQKVPVTVLSRCLQFNLAPMAPQTVREHLTEVLASEHVEAEPAALRLIARAARGSMRDALSLTDQAIAFGGGQLQEAPVRQMLGSVDRTHVLRLIEALAAGDARSVIATVDTLRTHGFSAAATLEDMSLLLQRMAVLQLVPALAGAGGPAADSDDGDDSQSDPEAAEASRLAGRMPADETQLLYSICLHGRAELGLAPDEYAGLTMVLLRLLAFKPTAVMDSADGPAAVPTAQKKTAAEVATAARPASAPAPAVESASAATATATAPGHPAARTAGAGAGNGSNARSGARSGNDGHAGEGPTAGVTDRSGRNGLEGANTVTVDDVRAAAGVSDAGMAAGGVSLERIGSAGAPEAASAPALPAAPALAPAAASAPASASASAPVPTFRANPVPPQTLPPPSVSSAAAPLGNNTDGASAHVPAEPPTAPAPAPAALQGDASALSAAAPPGGLPATEPVDADRQAPTAIAALEDVAGAEATGAGIDVDVDGGSADAARTGGALGIDEGATDADAGRPPAIGGGVDLGNFWHQAVQQLAASGAITALVRELALQSQLIAREDRQWTLRVASASLDQPVSRDRLAQALAADGHAVALLQVEIAAVGDTPARRIAAAAEQAQREALARIEGDPFVQSMMRDFGARIVPGSVRATAAASPQRAA